MNQCTTLYGNICYIGLFLYEKKQGGGGITSEWGGNKIY